MRRAFLPVLAVLLFAPAAARGQKFEAFGMAGYRFTAGIGSVTIGTLGVNDVRLENGVTFTLGATYVTGPQTEAGLEWTHQGTTLTYMVGNGPTLTWGDASVDTIHAVFHVGPERVVDQKFWPYALVGLGGTILGPSNGSALTRVTWTLGGGVKYMATDRFSLRAEGRWLPTYLFSSNTGIWCDPYYGCWQTFNSTYLQQVDLSAGVSYRF